MQIVSDLEGRKRSQLVLTLIAILVWIIRRTLDEYWVSIINQYLMIALVAFGRRRKFVISRGTPGLEHRRFEAITNALYKAATAA